MTTNSLFGWEGTKTSLQGLVSVTSLLPYTAGQMQWICLLGNFAMFVSETVFVLAVSAWAKNNLTALSVTLVSVVLPLMAFMILPGSLGEWVSTLLPAGGIGLSNALLYKMINFDFLFIGKHAFFQADVLLALAAVKIPLGIVLAVLGCRHKTAR